MNLLPAIAPCLLAPPAALPLPPTNDECWNATAISGTGTVAYTLVDATDSLWGQGNACTGGGNGTIHRDVWFTWSAPSTGLARVETVGLTFMDTKIAAYAGAGCPTVPALDCSNDVYPSVQSRIHFDCVQGAVYTIQVGVAFTVGPVEPSQLDVDVLTAPWNDDCTSPLAISAFGAAPFDLTVATAGAASQIATSCASGGAPTGRDVWFAWSSAHTGPVLFETCATVPAAPALDTRIAVFAGLSCPTPASLIACNDEHCSILSRVVFPAVAGQSYLIQVGDRSIGTLLAGEGVLRFRDGTPPSNDACATPIAIETPGYAHFDYDTTDATTGAEGQSEPACNQNGSPAIQSDLWFAFRPAGTGTAALSTCGGSAWGSQQDTKVAVYVGGGCPTGPALACNDDDGTCNTYGLESTLTFPTVCGQLYTIQIGRGIGVTLPTYGQFAILENVQPCNPGTVFCSGDGSATACPCGNAGGPGRGCANSVDAGGARLAADGSASLAGDTVVLEGSGMPNAACLYFQGTSRLAGGSGVAFGDGLRCAGGTVARLATKVNSGGASEYPELGDTPVSARGGVASPGARTYQVWYRNSAAFCTPSLFNLTNGLEIAWGA